MAQQELTLTVHTGLMRAYLAVVRTLINMGWSPSERTQRGIMWIGRKLIFVRTRSA